MLFIIYRSIFKVGKLVFIVLLCVGAAEVSDVHTALEQHEMSARVLGHGPCQRLCPKICLAFACTHTKSIDKNIY